MIAGRNKKKVLVAEDDPNIASALKKKFESHGCDVSICEDGVLCLNRLNLDSYDAVLLDLVMPKKTGFDVLSEKGGTKNADTPYYVLTNLGSEEHISQARDLGAKEVFVKAKSSFKEVTEQILREIGCK